MANGIIQFVKDLINDNAISTKTTYSSDKIEQLISSLSGIGTEVILGCFATAPTTFIQDDQYYDTTDGKIYKAISATTWDGGNLPKEDVLYASIDDKKIYSYIKGVWDIYGGGNTKISKKSNNILLELTGQTNTNENGLYVPLSKKSGNVIDNLTGQATDVNNGLFVGKSAKTDNALQKVTGSTNPSEDGLYVEDLNPRINRLDLTTKLNEDGIQEYFYLIGKYEIDANGNFVDNTTAFNGTSGYQADMLYYMKNETLNTTMDTNRYSFATNGTDTSFGKGGSYVILKAGITYKIKFSVEVYNKGIGGGEGSVCIFDENGNTVGSRGWTGMSTTTVAPAEAVVKFDKDTKIYFKYKISSDLVIYPSCSVIMIEAMEDVIIDPLQYVDNINGTQDIPIGTIINMMGNNAPKHYLKCDGSEYQIKDYPYLAQYFKEQFGSANKFGGDGITTFRTPDLKGEFLRNTGINGHANQGNGAAVGTHQDATEVNKAINYQNLTIGIDVGSSGWDTNNYDSLVSYSGGRRYRDIGISHNPSSSARVATVRPTNTSVLYCIKAEPTYFINVIGTTIEEDLLDTPTLLNTGTEISLLDLYTNYDKIKFVWKHNHKTIGDLYIQSMDLDVKDLAINNTNSAGIGSLTLTSVALNIPCKFSTCTLNFKDFNKIYVVLNIAADNDWGGIKLERVIGIKTTSTVQGGNFGGNSGSTNPSCDCGTLSLTDIANAITSTKTEFDK